VSRPHDTEVSSAQLGERLRETLYPAYEKSGLDAVRQFMLDKERPPNDAEIAVLMSDRLVGYVAALTMQHGVRRAVVRCLAQRVAK
jgi:hypothetical protein